MKKRIISRLLVCMMIFSLLPTAVFAADGTETSGYEWDTLTFIRTNDETPLTEGTDYTVNHKTYNTLNGPIPYYNEYFITTEEPITISGGGSYARDSYTTWKCTVEMKSNANSQVTLKDVTCLGTLTAQTGYTMNVTLEGVNNVDSIIGSDGTTEQTSLVFGGEGTLNGKHIGGAGGNTTSADITINSGTYNLNVGSDRYAAIGGGYSGSESVKSYADGITINGGTINAKGGYGAAIGGGQYGDAKNITITGSTIVAKANHAAAIGGGMYGYAEGINITGGNITASAGSGAAIGGGSYASAKDISVTGGTIIASTNMSSTGSYAAAVIGSGTPDYSKADPNVSATNITVRNCNLTASSTVKDPLGKVYPIHPIGYGINYYGAKLHTGSEENVAVNCGVYIGGCPTGLDSGFEAIALSDSQYIVGKTGTVSVANGKIVKGTFAFDVTENEYVSDTSTVTKEGGAWKVTPPTVNIGGETETTAGVIVEQKSEVVTTGEGVAEEIKELDETTKTAITTNTSVSGVNLTTEVAAEAPAGTESGLQAVVDAAVAKEGSAIAEAIANAETINIEVKVDVIPTEFKTSGEGGEGSVTFKLEPSAIVTVGTGDSAKSETVPVANSMIDQTKPITVNFYTGFKPAKITHTGDDGFEEVFRETGAKTFTYNETTKVCTLTISHFSELKAIETNYVAQIGEDKYKTLQAAVDAVSADATTITLLDDVMLKNVVNMKDGIILDCKGHTVSASKEADSYYMGESSKTNPSSSAVALLNIGNGQKVTIKNGIFETQAYARCNIGTGTGSELTLDNVKLIHVEYSSRGNDALQLNGALIVKNDLTIEMGSNIRYWKDKNGGEVPEGFINRAWGGISFNNDDCSIDFTNCTGFAVTDMEGEAYGLTQAPIHIYHTGTFDKDTIENTFMNVKAPANIKGMVKVIGNAWDMTGFAFANSAFLKNNYPVKIGDVYFQSIAKAVEYVENGETITLLEDVTLTDRLVISNGKTFTLDLGSKTLTGRVNVSGAKLTVKNGTINAGSMSQALNAYGTTDSNYNTTNNLFTYIKVENDVTLTGNYGMCFLSLTENSYSAIAYGVKVDFYGTANAPCGAFISGNIGATSDNRQGTLMHGENAPVFNVYGKLNATSGGAEDSTQGISLNGYTIVNVYEGAEISGAEAVGVKAGQLNVYGGTLTATGPKCDPVAAINSGTDASGGAIAVSSTYSAGTGKIIVNVKGGTIKSQNNAALLVTHSYKKNIAALFANGVEVMVEGGKFVGNGNAVFVADKLEGDSEYYPAKFISGGYYTADPSAYLANGYAVAGSDIQGYAYTVAKVDLPAGGNEKIAVTSEQPKVDVSITGVSGDTKTAIETAAAKTEVAGLGTDALKEAAKVNAGSAKAELEAALGTTVSNTVTVFAQTYLDVKPEAYSTEGDKVYTVDITPMVQLIATTAANAEDIKTENGDGKNAVKLGEPEKLEVTTPVVVTIPLPTGFAEENTVLFVKHTKDNGTAYLYKCTVQKTGEQLYIQFVNNNGFSTFEITTKDTSVASIVKGGSTLYYTSLRAAVEAVANGETITLTANCGETVTVARAVSFTLDKNGKTFSGSITPGANYKNTGSANEATISYVFTYVAPSGGGGGGGSTTPTTPTDPTTPEKKPAPPIVAPDAPAKMTDTAGHWGKEAIDYVISRGLFAGTSETSFSPNTQMTRAMVWTVLARLDGQDTSGGANWYAQAQTWAAANDISDGTLPQGNVTREQLIAILYRYSGSPEANENLNSFGDAGQISNWASDAMQWAVQNGLIVGSNNALNPQGDATRAEVATILMRYIQLITK